MCQLVSVLAGTWDVSFELADTSLCMQVAVKTVAFHTRAGEHPQERAIAEAAITFALVHKNVVATYSHEFKPLQIAPWGVVEATASVRGGIRGAGRGNTTQARDIDVWNLFGVQDWKLFLVQVCRLGL